MRTRYVPFAQAEKLRGKGEFRSVQLKLSDGSYVHDVVFDIFDDHQVTVYHCFTEQQAAAMSLALNAAISDNE